jgi:hypothetical protein
MSTLVLTPIYEPMGHSKAGMGKDGKSQGREGNGGKNKGKEHPGRGAGRLIGTIG